MGYNNINLTSPKCESAHCPFVSGLAITTFTPGRSWNRYLHLSGKYLFAVEIIILEMNNFT